ncbi:Hypothetical predicted protein [Pelobates cultripes]|uniref:Uncharacterized protein n=1 Tax=Pelobates cultripes TaxID=61616 RepID=A0AAD1QZV3_PELCU|nr:Hypothetical predicted protein [Pelobates cultripes]
MPVWSNAWTRCLFTRFWGQLEAWTGSAPARSWEAARGNEQEVHVTSSGAGTQQATMPRKQRPPRRKAIPGTHPPQSNTQEMRPTDIPQCPHQRCTRQVVTSPQQAPGTPPCQRPQCFTDGIPITRRIRPSWKHCSRRPKRISHRNSACGTLLWGVTLIMSPTIPRHHHRKQRGELLVSVCFVGYCFPTNGGGLTDMFYGARLQTREK